MGEEQMTSYIKKLQQMSKTHNSILCFGLDPVIERIPESCGIKTTEKIVNFYSSIIDESTKLDSSFSALKPNYGFFAQYGFDGLHALDQLIKKYQNKYTIILDAKRGDIGRTSIAYAKEAYLFWGADSVTLSAFMGYNSLMPYFEYFQKGFGAYILCRTSNNGANDFITQKLASTNEPLYSKILDKAIEWHQDGLGLVVGATDISDLDSILSKINISTKLFSLLIPGVGTQGGSAKEVRGALDNYPKLLEIARVNSSSSIAYAYQKQGEEDYINASLKEIKKLNKDLRV